MREVIVQVAKQAIAAKNILGTYMMVLQFGHSCDGRSEDIAC